MFIAPKSADKGGAFSILDSGLFGEIVGKDSKSIGFMTGFSFLDIPTAYSDTDGNNMALLPNGGFFPRVYTVIGESETGKTTAMIQAGGAIADSCWGATYVHIDAESNTTPERIMSLNRWDEATFKQKCMYVPPSPPKTINDVLDLIRRISHAKAAKGDKIKLKTPYRDMYTGKFIEVYPPTFMLLDSLPALVISQSLDNAVDGKKDFKSMEQIGSNVDGMREARDNTVFLRSVKSYLDEYNIIFVQINHVSKDVQMGMFDRPKKYHPGLKAGEKLSGGKEQVFQSFGLMRISQKEHIDDFNPKYGDKIRGYVCSLDHVKNKSNVSSNEYRYVFDKRTGFRPELTDFEYLYELKKDFITGSPASLACAILPEARFTRKNLVDKCGENPMLSRAMSYLSKYYMGNDMVIHNKFGEIDINGFANLPLEERYSIFASMTHPYPRFGLRKFGQEGMRPYQQIAAVGDVYTGLGNGYRNPVNVDTVQRIIHNHKRGLMYAKGCKYDPVTGTSL